MNTRPHSRGARPSQRGREKTVAPPAPGDAAVRAPGETSEMLLLPDGRLLVHNLTPAMARLLQELNPDDPQIKPRTCLETERATGTTHPL